MKDIKVEEFTTQVLLDLLLEGEAFILLKNIKKVHHSIIKQLNYQQIIVE